MVREIAVHDLKAMLDAKESVLLLDVRQPWEHQLARLPDSQLLPLPELEARAAEVVPADGQLVVTYCHHGVRSLDAAFILARRGIDVVSLAGGIDAWSQAIDPLVARY